jgi:mRNA interferase MazF
LVVQSDLFASADFVTVALVTSTRVASPTRVAVPATAATGLECGSWIMADKLHTVPRANLQVRCGSVPPQVMAQVERAILVYLGIAE